MDREMFAWVGLVAMTGLLLFNSHWVVPKRRAIDTNAIAKGVEEIVERIDGKYRGHRVKPPDPSKLAKTTGAQPSEILKLTYGFRPSAGEFEVLMWMAAEADRLKLLPEDQLRPKRLAMMEHVEEQLGKERAADLWRSMEPGNAEVSLAIDEFDLPPDTLEKWEALRTWGRAERDKFDPNFEAVFNSRLASILPKEEAYKKIQPWASAWLGCEGPSDLGFE